MTLSAERAYKQAIPLRVALEMYSRSELWNRFATIRTKPSDITPLGFISVPLADGTIPESNSPLAAFEAQKTVFGQLIEEFIALLTEAKLSSVAYKVPKLRDGKPIWIPASDWAGARIIWRSSEQADVDFKGAQYSGLRFVASPAFLAELKQNPDHNPKQGTRKRGTREPEIEAAWNALVRDNLVPSTGPLNANFDRVRAKVHELNPQGRPDNAGLGDKLLYRVLSPLRKEHLPYS